jgi:transcriptional regulator with XRE-family HTH domain
MTADKLRNAMAGWRRAELRQTTLRVQRDDTIRAAIATGWTHAAIAEATGLTRGRVNQIVRGRR